MAIYLEQTSKPEDIQFTVLRQQKAGDLCI